MNPALRGRMHDEKKNRPLEYAPPEGDWMRPDMRVAVFCAGFLFMVCSLVQMTVTLASGRYADALRAVERLGIGNVCATANQADLLGLADAARLSGRTGPAIVALAVLRERFPNTSSASTAAFALGRIAFERRANYFDAAHWFATYLEEAPSGPLMGDAAGRLIEARYRAGDRSGARRDAERYLHRFPRGPYAKTASEILAE